MKLRTLFITIALCGSTLSTAVTPVIKHQQIQQQKRIVNGAVCGELTRYEIKQLENNSATLSKQREEQDLMA